MNKIFCYVLTLSFTFLGAVLVSISHAQSPSDHQHTNSDLQTIFTDGEVKKVDLENGKVTIKHGDIPHLNMPGMTMVLTVKDKTMLATIQAGTKVRFLVIQEGGKLLVTEIHPTN